MLKSFLINEMRAIFGTDERRISHALKVLAYSEDILSTQKADKDIVIASAILHDIGIPKAEEKHNSSAGSYQEIEGPPVARKILQKTNLNADAITHICSIIANHHSAKNINTPEFQIIWDADWLVNIPSEFPSATTSELEKLINRIFKTHEGKKIATTIFLTENPSTT